MKLPLMTTLLAAAVLLQSPLVSAQVRPDRGNDDRREDRRGGNNPPERYRDEDRNDNRNDHRGNVRPDNDRRDDRNDRGGIRPRPEPRPPVRPNPRPDPYPRPNPRPDPYPNPYPPHNPNPPPSNHYGESSVQFYGVSRRSGGEWLRVQFNYAAYVDYVRVSVYRAGVQLHETYAITQSGRRVQLNRLSYTGTFYSGLTSEYLMAGERIVAIDIRAESMGGNADLDVRVSSSYGAPSIYPVRY
ncbi:beta-sandwich domain-containing protein [Bdellovibrio bacteriovorus]|uniref:beta-sandwich domain-containing protein n=1 Tax=Bdellovibrio bacteriovorus TaxID=959 RepID=UPI0021CDECA4|nr:beta-sandwich domain-containing protein [Bdellovibrio bacteriovorus]UXR66170.1 beta-sandwich domain-containing protein [Bdellovibrio bacteriovorus]